MIVYPVSFGTVLIGVFILWLLIKFGDDGKEELKRLGEENHRLAKERQEAGRKQLEEIEAMEQQKNLLAQMEALKDDLPKEVQVKLDT